MSGMGREVLTGVWDWSGDTPKGLGRVGRSYGRSETCGEVLRNVWDGSGDHPGGPGLVGGHSRRSRTGRGTVMEVRDLSQTFHRSWTGCRTLSKVRDWIRGLSRVPRRVEGPTGRSWDG